MNNSISYDINNPIKIRELFEKALTRTFKHNVKGGNSADQVLIEVERNDYLQRLIDFVNKYCLKNFTLVLPMELQEKINVS